LVPLLLGLALLPRYLVLLFALGDDNYWDWRILFGLVVSFVIMLSSIGLSIHWMSRVRQKEEVLKVRQQVGIRLLQALVLGPAVVCALLANWLFGWGLWVDDPQWDDIVGQVRQWNPYSMLTLLLDADALARIPKQVELLVFFGSWAAAIASTVYLVLAVILGWFRFSLSFFLGLFFTGITGFLASAGGYVIFGIMLASIGDKEWYTAFEVTVGVPLLLSITVVGANLAVGLFGKAWTEDVREWWASVCGWLAMYAALWMVIVGIALFGPVLGHALDHLGKMIVGSTWLVTVAGGAIAGMSQHTNGQGNRMARPTC